VVDQVLQERRRIQPPIRDDSSDSEDLPGREDTLPPGQPRRRSSDSEAEYWGAVADRNEDAAERADRDVASEDDSDSDDAGPDVPPNPYSRDDAPPDGWSFGQWVFARLLHQELAALDPPISIEPHNLVGTEGQQQIGVDDLGPLMAWTRARGRWELFGMMDIQWGPLSTVAGTPRTSDGRWRDAAFGYVDEDSDPALWDAWNERVQGAADAYPGAGTTLNWTPWVEDRTVRRRIAAFEMAVIDRALMTPGGRHQVSQQNYDRAVVAQRAEEREAAEADRAAQARADAAQEALRRPAQRQPSEDYTDRVRQNAGRR
jgi:hypothetical protein